MDDDFNASFTLASAPEPPPTPVDDLSVPADPDPLGTIVILRLGPPTLTSPGTIYYLTTRTPHTDVFTFHGPVKKFSHFHELLNRLVSSSPAGIDKLNSLLEDESSVFALRGFTNFVIPLERGGYTLVTMLRENNQRVRNVLPAPVYVVVAYGPMLHDCLSSQTVASGRPKGVAETGRVLGSFVRVEAAKEMARLEMANMLEGRSGVSVVENADGVRGFTVLGMDAERVWEVRVCYDGD
jgi:hypothetical protein